MTTTTETQGNPLFQSAPRGNEYIENIIIFGLDQMSSVAWYVLTHDSPYNVIAFTADQDYCNRTQLHGLPVIPFEEITGYFPPEKFGMHLPIGWKEMNALRARKLDQARGLGYSVVSYISSKANIWPDLCLGANCEIHQATSIGSFVSIGENCLIFGGTIGHHSVIGDHCYVGGSVLVCGGAVIGDRCVLGANCTVLDGVKVAPDCFIAAGALVTKDTLENSVYMGIPARRYKIPAKRLPTVL